jgi:hypothetical protein
VRLDHLLSKEHFSFSFLHTGVGEVGRDCFVPVCGAAGAHGWNADKHYRVGENIMFSSAVVISVHCWVLREHASVLSATMICESSPPVGGFR